MRLISLFFIKKEKEEDTDNYDLLINDALVAIIMTIITRFALKYKYYIHHIISLFFNSYFICYYGFSIWIF